MEMLGGKVDLSVDGLMRCFEAEFTLAFVNVNGLGGGGGGGRAGALREPIDSNSSFPVIPTFRMFLAALEILRHMLDFKSSMSCLGLGERTCGWAT